MDANTYINRELSWLEFNRRVLEEAKDESVPLMERVKFLAIFSSNLDEFFMVRVARLKAMLFEGDNRSDPDGLTPAEALTAISARVHELAAEQHLCFLNTIMPQLSAEGIHLVRPEEMSGEQERFLEDYFRARSIPLSRRWRSTRPIRFLIWPIARFVWWCRCGQLSLRLCRIPICPSSISRPRWRSALSRCRRVTDNMPSCCWKIPCATTCRASITALKFALVTPFG